MTTNLIVVALAAASVGQAFLVGAVFGNSAASKQFEAAALRLEPAMSISQQFVGVPAEVTFHSYGTGATYQCFRR